MTYSFSIDSGLLLGVFLISEIYGVKKIVIMDKDHFSGRVSLERKIIYLSKKLFENEELLLSVLFHEIGHLEAKRNNKYKIFHSLNKKHLTLKEKSVIVKTAWKAEKYVDNWAKKEMRKFFPNLNYKGYYLNASKDFKTDWKETWLSQFKS